MISILMPIYNGIEFIEESVGSILKQTYTNWELIIGINGHPEKSHIYQIAKSYESRSDKIRVYDFYTIKGKSNALNQMIKYCNYNYVALLDVDDCWDETKLEIQSSKIGLYDVIGTRCIYFGDVNGIVPVIPIGDISNFDFSKVNPIINSSVIILKEHCYWNENGIEDYDMWLRLKKQNKTFYNFNEVAVKHRIHRNSHFNAKGNSSKVPDLLKQHQYI